MIVRFKFDRSFIYTVSIFRREPRMVKKRGKGRQVEEKKTKEDTVKVEDDTQKEKQKRETDKERKIENNKRGYRSTDTTQRSTYRC